jgi:glycine betaine/proline transport system permease protein
MDNGFPELLDTRAFGIALDDAFTQVVIAYGETLEWIFLPVLRLLLWMENTLQWLPWWMVLAALTGLAWSASRRWGWRWRWRC